MSLIILLSAGEGKKRESGIYATSSRRTRTVIGAFCSQFNLAYKISFMNMSSQGVGLKERCQWKDFCIVLGNVHTKKGKVMISALHKDQVTCTLSVIYQVVTKFSFAYRSKHLHSPSWTCQAMSMFPMLAKIKWICQG